MSLTMTLVHAPGSLPELAWSKLRQRCPGSSAHECRVAVTSATEYDGISGAQLDAAVRRFIIEASGWDCSGLVITTAGFRLPSLEAGSAHIHPGMVLLLAPRTLRPTPVRPVPLSVCVESGPDAGQLVSLRRGSYLIGRAHVDITIADPQISRRDSVLEVGSREVRLRRVGQHPGAAVTTAEEFQLGATVGRLTLGAAAPSTPQPWPVPSCQVDQKPPEGRHAMMLIFALVPLVAGLVLALVTGLWFFLLFSGASAIVAAVIFLHGHRRRRQYQRARRVAAGRWAEQTLRTLVSPGQTAHLLRGEHSVLISAATAENPAVRLGLGRVEADLDTGSPSRDEPYGPELVNTAVGVELLPGEVSWLSGPLRECQRLQRWILLQLVLSPLDCEVGLLAPGTDHELPELRDLVRCRVVTSKEAETLSPPSTANGVLLAFEPVEQVIIDRALGNGWHLITPRAIPERFVGGSGWEVELDACRVRRRSTANAAADSATELRMDGLSRSTLRELLRLAIRHVSRRGAAAQLPTQTSHPLPSPLFSDHATEGLIAQLGPSRKNFEQLDLVSEGPHILVAGTTGSGKSELLKTLLLSLCARYSPGELSMVLVDFKGGATFQRMGALEHVLGVVTDLSQASAERTLESIRSELLRRERLFLEVGAGDYIEYRSKSPDPLPRMLLVIDEFRIFAHQLPHQLDELMRLATLGRSLGLHLVLSTQRPQGVVTAEIRANLGAAVALRVRGEDESRDIVGTAAAAHLPRTAPGRGLLRRPGERPIEFQTSQLQSAEPKLHVAAECDSLSPPGPEPMDQVVTTLAEQLDRRAIRRPHTPLMPPLPDGLHPQDALKPSSGVLLGRVDDPASQHQYDLWLRPDEATALALIGEPSAGAGMACASAASQVLSATDSAVLYMLDGDRSMAHLSHERRVGAWLTEEDMAEAVFLLDRLCAELTSRRMEDRRRGPPMVLVVTGYARWMSHFKTGREVEHQLGVLAAEGPSVGLTLILSGGRELAVGKLVGRFRDRIYLPLGSGEDVTYLWPKLRSTAPLPGRGVLLSATVPSPGLTVQLVTALPDPSPQLDHRAGTELSEPALRVRPLPERLPYDQLTAQADDVVVGVEQLSWAPATLPLGPVNLILGSAGTGKTTCLRLLEQLLPQAALTRPGNELVTDAGILLIDDAHRCSPEEHLAIETAVASGVPVVAAAPASGAVFHQLPWAHSARTRGSNVILSPQSRSEAEAFAAMIPLVDTHTPGRAVHLRPEGAVVTQWAVPPPRR